jgi:hypothetical protein
MITVPEAERIHNILIEQFGGSKGIRDKGSLESALFSHTKLLMELTYIQIRFQRPQLFLKA